MLTAEYSCGIILNRYIEMGPNRQQRCGESDKCFEQRRFLEAFTLCVSVRPTPSCFRPRRSLISEGVFGKESDFGCD